ncbi:uncharacterized protein Dmoj_GI27093, partial [Drosophila mojavensis]
MERQLQEANCDLGSSKMKYEVKAEEMELVHLACTECFNVFPPSDFEGQLDEFRMCRPCIYRNPELWRFLSKYIYYPIDAVTPLTPLQKVVQKCELMILKLKFSTRQYDKIFTQDSLARKDRATELLTELIVKFQDFESCTLLAKNYDEVLKIIEEEEQRAQAAKEIRRQERHERNQQKRQRREEKLDRRQQRGLELLRKRQQEREELEKRRQEEQRQRELEKEKEQLKQQMLLKQQQQQQLEQQQLEQQQLKQQLEQQQLAQQDPDWQAEQERRLQRDLSNKKWQKKQQKKWEEQIQREQRKMRIMEEREAEYQSARKEAERLVKEKYDKMKIEVDKERQEWIKYQQELKETLHKHNQKAMAKQSDILKKQENPKWQAKHQPLREQLERQKELNHKWQAEQQLLKEKQQQEELEQQRQKQQEQ